MEVELHVNCGSMSFLKEETDGLMSNGLSHEVRRKQIST